MGEFGTADLTGNSWVVIPSTRTYRNMVVIASSEFDFSNDDGDGRTARVRNKSSNSFEIYIDGLTYEFMTEIRLMDDILLVENFNQLIWDGKRYYRQ